MSKVTLYDTTTYRGSTGTWYFNFTDINNITISQSNAVINIPSVVCSVHVPKITNNSSTTKFHVGSCYGYLSGNNYSFNEWQTSGEPFPGIAQGGIRTSTGEPAYGTIFTTTGISINASNFFNNTNKNTKTVPLKVVFTRFYGYRQDSSTQYGILRYNSATDIKTLCNLTLNAPPTIEHFTINSDINNIYTEISSITLQATNVAATYSGDITNVTFQVGNDIQSIIPTENQTTFTATIIPTNSGSFTPTVTVTDSRGQTTTQLLNTTITVNPYISPSIDIVDIDRTLGEYQLTEDIQIEDLTKKYYERNGTGTTANPFNYSEVISPASNPSAAGYYELTNNKGLEDDEGTSLVVEIIPTYTSDIVYLEAPILQINKETSTSINPPIIWYTDRTLTTPVNWTNYKPNIGTHLYGYIADIFDTQLSYEIGLIPQDSIGTGSIVSQNLAPAFYTIDFLAGGHGIAFGQPCHNEGFYCNMDAYFRDTVGIMRAMFNLMHPIGSYYETSLPTTPTSGHSFDDDNLTNAEIADCGISWFDPRVMWGGTWVLEIAGMVHVSAGTGYSVNHANDNDGIGAKDGGSTDAILASHTHTLKRSTGVGVSVSAHGVTVTQPTIKLNVASPNNTGTLSTSQVQYGRPTGTNYTNDNAVSKTNVGVSLTNNHSVTVTQPVFTCDPCGEAVANKNMQPHINVYRWHRTN